jgi:urease accessory protein
MDGHLDLLAGGDADGRTVLRRQSFAAPIHISKPHHDAGWLVVNLASPTPGLFAGDRVDIRVRVESGACLLLTAPSANRVHSMAEGHAELVQDFYVAAGAKLDLWPEYLIPQAGARYRQKTKIHVEPGGTLLWTETVAPGRAARGEIFAFTEVMLATDVFHGARHLVRERYRLAPPLGTATLTRLFPEPYYASLLAVNAHESATLDLPTINALHDPKRCCVGFTRLGPAAAAIKIVAADSPTLRETIARARATLGHWMSLPSPNLRRVTGAPAWNERPRAAMV